MNKNSIANYFAGKELEIGLKDITPDELENLYAKIDTIRIDINPCIPLLKDDTKHTSKIYVNVWHADDLKTKELNKFYKISRIISEKIATNIQGLYIGCLQQVVNLEEVPILSKLITNVFFNKEAKATYGKAIDIFMEDKSVDYDVIEELWKPLIDYSNNIFDKSKTLDDYKPFIQTFYVPTSHKELIGIFGIVSGQSKVDGDVDVTQLIGVSPYPHDATIEVQIPIIHKT